jgi:hypothetical protein
MERRNLTKRRGPQDKGYTLATDLLHLLPRVQVPLGISIAQAAVRRIPP